MDEVTVMCRYKDEIIHIENGKAGGGIRPRLVSHPTNQKEALAR